MIKAIIVDDELKSREVIKTLVETFCQEIEIVDTAEDIVGALKSIRSHKPNLVFLDITLKEGDSFQILQELDEITFEIIFVTAYDEYSVKALKYSGITCLFKPLDIEELQEAVKKVASKKTNMNTAYQMVNGILKSKFTKIPVITSGGLVFKSVDKITFIQRSQTGSTIHFDNGATVDSQRKIPEFEDIILNNHFRRIGSDYLVNTSQLHVPSITKTSIVFNNDERIEVSSSDIAKLLDVLRA